VVYRQGFLTEILGQLLSVETALLNFNWFKEIQESEVGAFSEQSWSLNIDSVGRLMNRTTCAII